MSPRAGTGGGPGQGSRRRRALGLAAALLLVAAIAGCGGDPVEPAPVGEPRAGGSVATLADCGDWREGSVDERLATIAHVRSEVGADEAAPEEVHFSDEDAYEYFTRACAPRHATSVRLYKLYNRGATFSRLER